MLAMLVLARLCLILFIWGSLGIATAGPCSLLFNFIFQYYCFIWGSLGFAMSLVLLFHYWGLLWDLRLYPKAILPLSIYCNVNCLPVNESGPFRRLTTAVTVCSAAFLFWLFKYQAASFIESWFLPFSYGFVLQMPPRRSTRSKRPSSQALVSCGFTSLEEAYCGSQFTIQW